jgi:hypothetical protein
MENTEQINQNFLEEYGIEDPFAGVTGRKLTSSAGACRNDDRQRRITRARNRARQ